MDTIKATIEGHLDIYVVRNGETNEIYINGDPLGLRSLSNTLVRIANIIEEEDSTLLIGDREHVTLQPNMDLSKSSDQLTIGRLEAKLTGNFYERYVPRENTV
jgi:hypothetical protein